MTSSRFITALATPLQEDESLDQAGLAAQIEDQCRVGIEGVLVAGSMGQMQLLSDQTYRDLIEKTVELTAGRNEVMVGIGDVSFVRTRQRLEWVDPLDFDAVMVISPYFVKFSPDELVGYYHALADISRHPLYLYDLPQLTGVKLDFETVERTAEHPNIHGIKCSGPIDWTIQLIDRMGDQFRVITAQPRIMDSLFRAGVSEHLDGIFAVAPDWCVGVGRAADAGDWQRAAHFQRLIVRLFEVLCAGNLIANISAIMNARGISGKIGPAPYQMLSEQEKQAVLAEDIVQELLATSSDPKPVG